jgi:glycosyltransferase involved in cell wall biosynthesis
MSYVLVTAAHNEAQLIEGTLSAVVAQTVRPDRWVVVSDGSTDETDDIVRNYGSRFAFIELLRIDRDTGRDFVSKIHAVRAGFARLVDVPFDFVGNLDADVSFEPTYFERLLARFAAEPALGIGGGWILEAKDGVFEPRPYNTRAWVPHAVQLLRRACYQDIGDYVALPYGGEDTWAVGTARMHGWQAASFPDLPVRHHRRTSSAGGVLRNRFRSGLLDHSLGYHPAYEVLKCARRIAERPYVIGTALGFAGFVAGYLRHARRPVSNDFVQWMRRDQVGRVAAVVQRRGVPLA